MWLKKAYSSFNIPLKPVSSANAVIGLPLKRSKYPSPVQVETETHMKNFKIRIIHL